METLVVVAQQHRNQYYGKVKSHGSARFPTSPSASFREINCRTFQSGAAVLPTPFPPFSTSVPKRPPSSSSFPSPKTPSPNINPPSSSHSFDYPPCNLTSRSSPIPITDRKDTPFTEDLAVSYENLPLSELWAGPAYSNSPPPSSLPIPKFSIKPKRTISLDFPVSDPGFEVRPFAKSAPASPTREHNSSIRGIFLSADSATQTLRRILNLDLLDE